MTAFEITVLLICASLAMTNFVGFAHHPKLKELPGWYIGLVAFLALTISICLAITIVGALS